MVNKPKDKYEKCTPELRLKYEAVDMLDVLVKSVTITPNGGRVCLGTTAIAEDIIAKTASIIRAERLDRPDREKIDKAVEGRLMSIETLAWNRQYNWEEKDEIIREHLEYIRKDLLDLYFDVDKVMAEIFEEIDHCFELAPEDDGYFRIMVKNLSEYLKTGKRSAERAHENWFKSRILGDNPLP